MWRLSARDSPSLLIKILPFCVLRSHLKGEGLSHAPGSPGSKVIVATDHQVDFSTFLSTLALSTYLHLTTILASSIAILG